MLRNQVTSSALVECKTHGSSASFGARLFFPNGQYDIGLPLRHHRIHAVARVAVGIQQHSGLTGLALVQTKPEELLVVPGQHLFRAVRRQVAFPLVVLLGYHPPHVVWHRNAGIVGSLDGARVGRNTRYVAAGEIHLSYRHTAGEYRSPATHDDNHDDKDDKRPDDYACTLKRFHLLRYLQLFYKPMVEFRTTTVNAGVDRPCRTHLCRLSTARLVCHHPQVCLTSRPCYLAHEPTVPVRQRPDGW